MTIKIIIPTPLRPSVNQQKELDLDQLGSVKSVILTMIDDYPKLKVYLMDDKQELRKFVNFYVNDVDIRDLNNADTQLKSGDILSIVPAIAGGCR
tara:strand:- start:128 stop:412 length:285 start_codon:yes stop_codon:yes gene_type:complete